MNSTWLLVANGSEARLFAFNDPRRPGRGVKLLDSIDHPKSRQKGSDLASDRPGAYLSAAAGTSHGAYSDTSDPKGDERDRFSRELAEILAEAHQSQRFKRLVLVAPPQMHGLLNRHLDKNVQQTVSQHIDKDYTKLAERELVSQVSSRLLPG